MRRKRPPKRDPHEMGMSEELMLLTGMKEWRHQHPRATLREIEEAMDERLAKLRAGMLEDLVKMSPQADWSQGPQKQRPRCERSRWRAEASGGDGCKPAEESQVQLDRSYGTCPQCGQGLFPPR